MQITCLTCVHVIYFQLVISIRYWMGVTQLVPFWIYDFLSYTDRITVSRLNLRFSTPLAEFISDVTVFTTKVCVKWSVIKSKQWNHTTLFRVPSDLIVKMDYLKVYTPTISFLSLGAKRRRKYTSTTIII